MLIDKLTSIHSSAEIGENVSIGPWSTIGPNVKIGANTKIGPNVVIKENTTIGANNTIHQFASIGGDPQTKDYSGGESFLEIGDNNTFHENVTINRGDKAGNNLTKIGNNNLFMSYVHVAHDCIIKNNTIFVGYSGIAGHVEVDDYAIVGGYSAAHQFCKIGKHCLLTHAAIIIKDVVPFTIVSGNPAKLGGINKVGLSRRGYSKEEIRDILRCYRIIFRNNLTTEDAISTMKAEISSENVVEDITSSLANSTRGIVR